MKRSFLHPLILSSQPVTLCPSNLQENFNYQLNFLLSPSFDPLPSPTQCLNEWVYGGNQIKSTKPSPIYSHTVAGHEWFPGEAIHNLNTLILLITLLPRIFHNYNLVPKPSSVDKIRHRAHFQDAINKTTIHICWRKNRYMFSNYCHSLQMIGHQSFWHRRKQKHKKHSKYLKNNNIEITEKL